MRWIPRCGFRFFIYRGDTLREFLQSAQRFISWFTGYFPFYFGSILLGLGAFWAYQEIGSNQYDYILLVVGGTAIALMALGLISTILGTFYLRIYLTRYPYTANINVMEGFRSQTGFRL